MIPGLFLHIPLSRGLQLPLSGHKIQAWPSQDRDESRKCRMQSQLPSHPMLSHAS